MKFKAINIKLAQNQLTQLLIQATPSAIAIFDTEMHYLMVSDRWKIDYRLGDQDIIGKSHYDIFPAISESWKAIHQACIDGETRIKEQDKFARSDGSIDYIKWEIRPWYTNDDRIGGIIMFTEVITEMIEMRNKLNQQIQIQEMMINNLPDFSIVLFDHDLRIMLIGGDTLRKNGHDVDAIQGKMLHEVVSEDVYDILLPYYKRALNGESFFFERRPEHTGQILHSYANPIKDQEGRVIAGLMSTQNVTNVEQTRQQLEESQAQFSGIVHLAADAIISIDEQQTITLFNKAAENMFGWTVDEVVGQPIEILLPDRYVERHKSHINSFRSGSATKYMGERQRLYGKRKNESEFPIEASISRIEMKDSITFTVIIKDITEHLQQIDYLDFMQARFRAIFNNAFQLIGFMNPEGILLEVNETALVFADIREEDVVGKPFWETKWWSLSLDIQEKLRDSIQKAATGEFVRYEVDVVGKDDAVITIDFSIKPVFDANDKVIQLIPEGRNITDMVLLREELERSNNELQNFAYIASHDLQEPLRMVTSFLNLLKDEYDGQLSDDADQYIDFAVDGAQRMKQLIQDLLSYSRISTQGDEFVHVDMDSVLQNVLDNLAVTIYETDATIICNTSLPTIKGDKSQLTSLLQNLISNAIKFQQSDQQPIIMIAVEEKGAYWQFEISDNGIGIDPKYYDRIFTIFKRLHNRTNYAGTGIGLAMCKKIVERHSGTIWLDSILGEGSKFNFLLPIIVEKETSWTQ